MCHLESLTQTWIHNRQEITGQQKPAKGGITMCCLKLHFCEHFRTQYLQVRLSESLNTALFSFKDSETLRHQNMGSTFIIGLQRSDTVFLPLQVGIDTIQSAMLH